MEKTLRIRLFQSTAGRDFAYGKGENDVPEERAREFIRAGLAELVEPSKGLSTAQAPHQTAEKGISQQAKAAEKRNK